MEGRGAKRSERAVEGNEMRGEVCAGWGRAHAEAPGQKEQDADVGT